MAVETAKVNVCNLVRRELLDLSKHKVLELQLSPSGRLCAFVCDIDDHTIVTLYDVFTGTIRWTKSFNLGHCYLCLNSSDSRISVMFWDRSDIYDTTQESGDLISVVTSCTRRSRYHRTVFCGNTLIFQSMNRCFDTSCNPASEISHHGGPLDFSALSHPPLCQFAALMKPKDSDDEGRGEGESGKSLWLFDTIQGCFLSEIPSQMIKEAKYPRMAFSLDDSQLLIMQMDTHPFRAEILSISKQIKEDDSSLSLSDGYRIESEGVKKLRFSVKRQSCHQIGFLRKDTVVFRFHWDIHIWDVRKSELLLNMEFR